MQRPRPALDQKPSVVIYMTYLQVDKGPFPPAAVATVEHEPCRVSRTGSI